MRKVSGKYFFFVLVCFRGVPLQSLSWVELNDCHHDELPNVLELVDLVLALPASSAICEQGFSVMKRVKNDWRSKLGKEALNDQMRIILHREDDTFDPTPAIEAWLNGSGRKRRLSHAVYKKHKADDVTVDWDILTSSDESYHK